MKKMKRKDTRGKAIITHLSNLVRFGRVERVSSCPIHWAEDKPINRLTTLGVFLAALLAAFFYLGVCLANPEAVTFKSALVWRTDAQGDYVMDELSSPGTYEINTAYTTEGTIETITANYKFKGEVTMEVSADNGLHYTPIVNGVPLTSGFTRGSRLKWRVTLIADSQLTEVRLAYTDSLGVAGTFGEPRLSGFSVRKPIVIARSEIASLSLAMTEGDLFNYQVRIRVGEIASPAEGGLAMTDVHCDGEIQEDFKDVRFTATDGETLLAHYLEGIEGEAPKRIATFYVKIPQIPKRGLALFIYYGNPEAEDISSGNEVFDFFDDFEAEELDAEKWETYPELGGGYSVIDSRLKLDAAKVISRTYRIKDGIIEYRATPGYEARAIIRAKQGALELTQMAYSSAYKGAEHSIVIGDFVKINQNQPILPDTPYDYRIIARGENITFERKTSLRGASVASDEAISAQTSSVSYKDTGGLKRGSVGLETGSGSISYYDWLRVRKFAEPEPEITSSGKEEPTNLARFSGTALAEDGTLIASSSLRGASVASDEATYISKVIPVPFQTRIMVPSFVIARSDSSPSLRGEAEAISLNISADRGKTYKTGCRSGSYYYASREDFTAGSNLRYRAVIVTEDAMSEEMPRAPASGRASEATQSPQLSELSIDYRPGNILLVSPNGGDLWQAGSRQKILWLASDYEPAYPMRIEYSLDNGQTYNTIIEERENIGVYFWRIPRRLSGKKLIIKVSDALDGSVYDTSDGLLEIIK